MGKLLFHLSVYLRIVGGLEVARITSCPAQTDFFFSTPFFFLLFKKGG